MKRSKQPQPTPVNPYAHLRPFELWWAGSSRYQVVGEFYRKPNIIGVVQRRGGPMKPSGELSMAMQIVREPTNPADPGAVAVLVDGVTVGYIAKEDARSYHAPLDRLALLGLIAQVPGSIRWWTGYDDNEPDLQVSLELGPAARILPMNSAPPMARLLPVGKSVAIKEFPEALPTLASIMRSTPHNEAVAWALLRATRDPKGNEIVVVVIDGTSVGTITPASSAHFLPIIRWGNENRLDVACRALLVGNQLDVQVTIHAAKASEVPPEWLVVAPAPAVPSTLPVSPPVGLPAFAPATAPATSPPVAAALPPAGWQSDPTGRHQLRYWDGAGWSTHVHNDGVAAIDPL